MKLICIRKVNMRNYPSILLNNWQASGLGAHFWVPCRGWLKEVQREQQKLWEDSNTPSTEAYQRHWALIIDSRHLPCQKSPNSNKFILSIKIQKSSNYPYLFHILRSILVYLQWKINLLCYMCFNLPKMVRHCHGSVQFHTIYVCMYIYINTYKYMYIYTQNKVG